MLTLRDAIAASTGSGQDEVPWSSAAQQPPGYTARPHQGIAQHVPTGNVTLTAPLWPTSAHGRSAENPSWAA